MSEEKIKHKTMFGNKFALGLTTSGQPPKFKSADEIGEKINSYFESLETPEDENGNKEIKDFPTITGLALYLGFESRQSIYDYKEKKEFSYILKRATLAIESSYEQRLFYNNPTGAIFALKNMGWIDKIESDITITDQEKLTKELKEKFNDFIKDQYAKK